MIIDCISDLHGFYPNLNGGDLLIVSGDITANDKLGEWCDFFIWFSRQRYKKKILIGGNHDNFLANCDPVSEAKSMVGMDGDNFEYLCNSGTEFEGVKIWGSPHCNSFPGVPKKYSAFMHTETELESIWKLIPDDIDILATHGPGYGLHDVLAHNYHHAGSVSLSKWLARHKDTLKLFVCGHIHEGYGSVNVKGCTINVNCSHCDEDYEPVNKPIRVILD